MSPTLPRSLLDSLPARKRLVMLFCDLSGSTRLAAELEAEELDELQKDAAQICDRIGTEHGGLSLRSQGDGSLLVFGLPQPGEDDGRRAVEAALDIHAAIALLRPGLLAHSGIHAGVVLVKPGDARRGVLDLIGMAVNQTAHLAEAARSGEILVSLEALGPYTPCFQLRTRGDQEPGLPLPSLSVVDRSGARGRFEAAARRGLAPLVGREALRQQLHAFAFGDGPPAPHCAVLVGTGGLGKSRLLDELHREARKRALPCLAGSFDQALAAEPLRAFRQMLPVDAGADAESLVVELERQSSCAGGCQLLLLVDDWQWADMASRALLHRLLQGSGDLRVVLARRPGEEGDEGPAGALRLQLQPLGLDETHRVASHWLPALDPFSIQRIHERTGGVPLLIEELCHGVAAQGDTRQLVHTGLPAHWGHEMVVSRAARLPAPMAELLERCAVVGMQLPKHLLRAALDEEPDWRLLDALVDVDFLRHEPQVDAYQFKHGVTHEALYESVGLALKRAVHARLSEVLWQRHQEGEDCLDSLALHSRGAAQWPRAAWCAEQAGDRATALQAIDRARVQYLRAMDAIERQPSQPELHRQWVQLCCKLGFVSLFDPLSCGDDLGVFRSALQRAENLGDAGLVAQACYWLAYMLYGTGHLREGIRHARRARGLASAAGQERLRVQIEAALGQLLAAACEYQEAIQLLESAVLSKRERGQRPAPARAGVAVGSAYALACAASVHADQGRFDAAHAALDEALELLQGVHHPINNSVWNWQAVVLTWEGRWVEADQVAARSARYSESTGALLLLAVSRAVGGFARWAQGEHEAGLRQLRDAVRWIETRGGRFYIALYLGWLVQVCMAQGLREEARQHAAKALQRARQGERLGEATACRALAWQAWREGRPDQFERWMRRAESSARRRHSLREAALNESLRGVCLRGLAPAVLEPWFNVAG